MKKNSKQKENPLIKNKKNIKIRDYSDDQSEIKTFFVIIAIIVILIGAIYGLTEMFNKKELEEAAIKSGKINYDITNVGTLLNRPYSEYYVLLYKSDDSKAVIYSTIMTKYINKENDNNLKIYYCDLSNSLNESYYNVLGDNISNPKAQKVNDFDFGDLTLIKVKNGNVIEYIESFEEIKSLLK